MNHRRLTLAFVLAVVLVVGCGAAGASQPTASPSVLGSASPGAARTGHLLEALKVAPARMNSLGYTDWASIRDAYPGPGLSDAATLEAKLAFLRDRGLGKLDDVANRLGDASRTQWGFEAFDLLWEIRQDIPLAWILRFQDDFDLAPVVARFDVRGFSTEDVGDGVLRTHEIWAAPWLLDPSFANAGVLGDHILVFATDPALVRDVLDGGRGVLEMEAARGVAEALDEPLEAAVMTDPMTCRTIIEWYRHGISAEPALIEASKEQLAVAEGLDRYESLAVGSGVGATGHVVMSFADASVAAAELGARRALATEGVAWSSRYRTSQPLGARTYADEAFTVAKAEAVGANIVLSVDPSPDGRSRLLDLVRMRDLLFAGCG